jgi:hypothetical protein
VTPPPSALFTDHSPLLRPRISRVSCVAFQPPAAAPSNLGRIAAQRLLNRDFCFGLDLLVGRGAHYGMVMSAA